jgi:hypothetical protein
MPEVVLIHITREHLAHGIRHDPYGCPGALALREELPLPPGYQWAVDYWTIKIVEEGSGAPVEYIDTPDELRTFMHWFDQGRSNLPKSFWI